MPSNIFANTGTNVSILFLDSSKEYDKAILIDASNLGEKIKVDGKNQRTVLRETEITSIIDAFNHEAEIEDFSVYVSYDRIRGNKNSLSASQYFAFKLPEVAMTEEEFGEKVNTTLDEIDATLSMCANLDKQLRDIMGELKWGN